MFIEDHPFQCSLSKDEPARAICVTKNFPYFDERCDLNAPNLDYDEDAANRIKEQIIATEFTKYINRKAKSLDHFQIANPNMVILDQKYADASLTFGGVNSKVLNDFTDYISAELISKDCICKDTSRC